ncbi:outer membrane protein [Dyadobacter endophyticus]|uniref:Outer membrane protein n=1 Tax=Dyadobacter endophyticus TaxID=1749036 RepID=A0ABQ1YGM8_9BACT|nr:TolC family protein [Dyadobacter endophyticus]GGH24686.1 outer membrane protein [Dyadobacter endophyticus]
MICKSKGKFSRLTLIALLLTHLSAFSQKQTLTLPQALQHALQASQTAKKAMLDVENAIYKNQEARGRVMPQLSATGSMNYNPILQLTALPGELAGQPGKTLLIAFGQKWNTGASLALTQNLFDKTVFTGLKAARSSIEYYQLNAALTQEQLIEQVASAYYQVLVERHKISVIDSTIAYTIKVQNVITGQYQNGLIKEIDVDRIGVNVTNLRTQRQQLINSVEQKENQLKYAMGMDILSQINLPAIDLDSIRPSMATFADAGVPEDRTEMMLIKKQEQLLILQKDTYKAANFPVLSFSGNYGYQGLGNTFPLFKGQQHGINWFDYASLGMSLKIPIFNGFTTRAKIRQADVQIRRLQEDISQTSLSLSLESENAKAQVRNSLVILDDQKENIRLARKVFLNTKNNYDNGLATLTDLLEVEKSLTEANNNHAAATLDYKLAEIKLIKAQGNLKSLLNP